MTSVTYPVDGRASDTALLQYANHQVATKAISALNGKTFKGIQYVQVSVIKQYDECFVEVYLQSVWSCYCALLVNASINVLQALHCQ